MNCRDATRKRNQWECCAQHKKVTLQMSEKWGHYQLLMQYHEHYGIQFLSTFFNAANNRVLASLHFVSFPFHCHLHLFGPQ